MPCKCTWLSRQQAITWHRMLKRIIAVIVALVVQAVVLPGISHAQSAVTNWNPGLPLGAPAPAFKLIGQDGKEHDLAELLVKGKLALVFQRSADW
jgi:cytochrome oxidase Cu insertion factor (SCO1/SenC/PrrC family)